MQNHNLQIIQVMTILMEVACKFVIVRPNSYVMSMLTKSLSERTTGFTNVDFPAFFAYCSIYQLTGLTVPSIIDLDCDGSVVFGEGSFGGEFLTTWFLMDFGRLKAIKGRVSNILAVDVSFSRM